MDFKGYWRQARRLPPKLVLQKAVGLILREAGAFARMGADIITGSYSSAKVMINPAARIAMTADDIPPDLEANLKLLSRCYLNHRFDLLGSGWVEPFYGYRAVGFLGRKYEPSALGAPDKTGGSLAKVVNRSNLRHSEAIWRLIGNLGYRPIDWQMDVRSGYRWSSRWPSVLLSIPVDKGADIKMPWELARLQHLPQLALCAILSQAGRSDFISSSRYIEEISDQLCDFIATNPPRFGVNWVGAMEVAIRAANISMTLALLAGAGFELGPAVMQIVLASLDQHADYVCKHLEYSESGRSNHYLADLGGIVWASWTLAGSAPDSRLKFAMDEMLREADHQFLADGGNYEGSTSYHRLSSEIVTYSLAVIASLDESTVRRLGSAARPVLNRRMNYAASPQSRIGAGGAALVPVHLRQKLKRAAKFSRAIQGSDRTAVQIGDNDSGRFFRLHPVRLEHGGSSSSDDYLENHLDHTGTIDAMDALFGGDPTGRHLDATVIVRLTGGATLAVTDTATVSDPFGDLQSLMARWQAAPEKSRRVERVAFGTGASEPVWNAKAFPDFGLYCFRAGERLVTFRCFGRPAASAPTGHRHDDNLSIEYRLGDVECRDPGTFVYTSAIVERNLYRSAAVHGAPRVRGESLTKFSSELFELSESAYAECLYWGGDGVAGEIRTRTSRILRIVLLSAQHLSIFDCVQPPAVLDVDKRNVPFCRGYGVRSESAEQAFNRTLS